MVDGCCLEWLNTPALRPIRRDRSMRNGATLPVVVHINRAVDFRNFVGFLPVRIYGYSRLYPTAAA